MILTHALQASSTTVFVSCLFLANRSIFSIGHCAVSPGIGSATPNTIFLATGMHATEIRV